ncbi:branched chain amino acid aminotransferase [Streptomyces antimycoticus]|uniref:Branched-chain-amino-acid aminotransferase n=1 Tax=Streptomyces antimycoticus TaxID=68175 RepID=A0A499UCF9_9ACTN|nr:branched-chain-amino-acid transaminase [Streptomyces antimycoticus]BBJ37320.1 branched chain amino acid aminotransferase [Streptomyces antimycoticus]
MHTTTGLQDSGGALGALAAPVERTAPWLWRSGRLVPWEQATVHVNAVGHASVAAVFEGIKAYRSADGHRLLLFRLDDHLRRLYASARVCRTTIPFTADELRDAVIDTLRANAYREDTYIRPWAFPRGVIREQMVPAGVECEVVIDTWPFTSHLFTRRACSAVVSSWTRVDDATMPPRVKAFSNYHNGRLALLEARTGGYDWPVLLNARHQVSEGPGACIALVREGVVITPSLTSGVLESVTRSSALTLLRERGVPVEEREVDRTELYLADEIFFLGTGWEVLPVGRIDGLPVGDGGTGPVAQLLERAYDDSVRGRDERHPEWLKEVPC